MLFLTHHNLQGSQTIPVIRFTNIMFLTHHNLQGSQTILLITFKNLVVSYPS